MTITKEYKIAYVEVLEVLKDLNKEEFERIPKERLKIYEENKDNDYNFELDKTRDFNEQISNIAQAIIANLFVRFIATEEDRKKIYEIEKQEYIENELEKRKEIKLNPLFDEPKKEIKETSIVVVKKKTFFLLY